MDSNTSFDEIKVIRGLFNEESWTLGSPMFWLLTEVLSQKWNLKQSFLPVGGLPLNNENYIELRHLQQDIKDLLNCSQNIKSFDSAEIQILARDLMDKYFRSIDDSKIINRYLNIKNPDYYNRQVSNEGFGNNAIDFVIASYYDAIASTYGNKIVILKDNHHKSVDLGYWNWINNNVLWDSWVDNGEVDIPGYIESSDLLGFQKRKNDRDHTQPFPNYPSPNPIEYGIYKLNYEKQTIVIFVSTENNETCLMQSPLDQKIYYCKLQNPESFAKGFVALPQIQVEKKRNLAPLMGAAVLCSNKTSNCQIPDSFWKWYGRSSDASVTDDLISKINTTEIILTSDKNKFNKTSMNSSTNSNMNLLMPQKIHYFKNPTPIQKLSTIEIISATYSDDLKGQKGNVTSTVSEYCNGKQVVTYKVSPNHLQLNTEKSEDFEVEWICSNTPKIKHHFNVPATSKNKLFEMSCMED